MVPETCDRHVMIVAGEASGDLHGANLMKAYKRKHVNTFFSGIGGSAMKEQGLSVVVEAETLSVVGITEVFSKLPVIFQGMAKAKNVIKLYKPDLLILIDFPDFNLRLAKFAKRHGVPILYYISPQIWAWRQGRVKKMKRLVDHMAVILPFEASFYETHGIPVTFVGHPLLDHTHTHGDGGLNDDPFSLDLRNNQKKSTERQPIIGFLPGSREKEVTSLLPVMIKTAVLLLERLGNPRFIISHAGSVDIRHLDDIVKEHAPPDAEEHFEIVSGGVHHVLERADFIVAASGTVTLEAAMALKPMIIIYKVSPLSYRLGRLLIRVDHIGLVNLIAGERVVPELIQGDAEPEKISKAIMEIFNDPDRIKDIHEGLTRVKNILGGPGASAKAANIALDMLKKVADPN